MISFLEAGRPNRHFKVWAFSRSVLLLAQCWYTVEARPWWTRCLSFAPDCAYFSLILPLAAWLRSFYLSLLTLYSFGLAGSHLVPYHTRKELRLKPEHLAKRATILTTKPWLLGPYCLENISRATRYKVDAFKCYA